MESLASLEVWLQLEPPKTDTGLFFAGNMYRDSARRLQEFYQANASYRAEVEEEEAPFLSALREWADENGFSDGSIADTLKTRDLEYTRNPFGDKVTIVASGITSYFATRIRRAALSLIPAMAIDDTHIIINASIYHEDLLRARIKLLTLRVDPSAFEKLPVDRRSSPEVKLGQYNDENALAFYVDSRTFSGDRELNEKGLDSIYTRDILEVPVDAAVSFLSGESSLTDLRAQASPTEAFAFADVEILRFSKREAFAAIMFAYRGTSQEHANFAVLSDFTYRHVTDVLVSDSISPETSADLVKVCPFKVFDIEDSGLAFVKDTTRCTLCMRCLRPAELSGVVATARDLDRFVFKLESIGGLDPKTIFDEAVRIAIREEARRV